MLGRRVDRIEEQLRMELSEIVERELSDPRIGLVTVTGVKITSDLRHARVMVSVLGGADERKKAVAGLRSAASFVKRSLARRLHHLRRITELIFEYDDTLEDDIRIQELFNQIKTEPEKPEPEKT